MFVFSYRRWLFLNPKLINICRQHFSFIFQHLLFTMAVCYSCIPIVVWSDICKRPFFPWPKTGKRIVSNVNLTVHCTTGCLSNAIFFVFNLVNLPLIFRTLQYLTWTILARFVQTPSGKFVKSNQKNNLQVRTRIEN